MSSDNDPLNTILPLWLLAILWSFVLGLVVLVCKKIPMPSSIIIALPYFAALFPFPCPLWLTWYEDASKSAKLAVKVFAVAWVGISIAGLFYFVKNPR